MRGAISFGAVLLLACGLAAAQSSAPAPNPTTKPCSKKKGCPTPSTPSDTAPVSQSLPGSDADVPSAPAPAPAHGNALPGNDADVPGDVPAAPAPQKSSGKPVSKDALPGSDADVPGDEPTSAPAPSLPSSSSSSEGGFSSSHNPEADAAPAPTTQDDDSPVKASPLKDMGSSGTVSVDRKKLEARRVEDDIKVAKFYQDDGNLMGAYLRFKDAVSHDEDQEDAQWGWADLADRLKKPDEAREHYKAYLELDPKGPHAKEAQQALNRLSATAGKK